MGNCFGGAHDSPETPKLSTFRRDVLRAHNDYRKHHKAQPLKLNATMNSYAQRWAEHIANANMLYHRPDNDYGENLWYYSGTQANFTGYDPVKSWYNEVEHHDFKSNNGSNGTGRFSQIVWRNTRQIGVGMKANRLGRSFAVYVVVNYDPSGNVSGRFRENVIQS